MSVSSFAFKQFSLLLNIFNPPSKGSRLLILNGLLCIETKELYFFKVIDIEDDN